MLQAAYRPFTERQEKLHIKIIKLRHQVYAHSDSSKFTLRPFKLGDSSSTIAGRPVFMLSKCDIRQLKTMIKKLMDKMTPKHSELQLHFAELNEIDK